ncbi:MAG: hypothetical protein HOH69_02015 [Gammaproteobacteria bacterium]|jgi:hypothetical protein|nr:hypothetical protein [Gammaproteobacteria bacterium]
MKRHIGMDDTLGLIHSRVTASANTRDRVDADLFPDKKECVWGQGGL